MWTRWKLRVREGKAVVGPKALSDRVEQSRSLSPDGDTHIEQTLAQLAPYLSAPMSPPQKGPSQAP